MWRHRHEFEHDMDFVAFNLREIHTLLETLVTDQAALDADVQKIRDIVTEVQTATGRVSDEIAGLKAANPTLDVSGLESAITDLGSAAAGVDALAPAAPVVEPPAAPVDGQPASA